MKRKKSSYHKRFSFRTTMNIGILGGTFDPIHKGHMMIAEQAYQLFSLHEIWFLPNGNPPHKSQNSIGATPHQRLEMVNNAIKEMPYYHAVTYEIERVETSYSYETLAYLRATYPEHTFYFIVGADTLFSLENWKYPDLFLKECILIATYRDNKCNEDDIRSQIMYLSQKYTANIQLLEMPLIPISSREIRAHFQSNSYECLEQYLATDTLKYIQKNNIYR